MSEHAHDRRKYIGGSDVAAVLGLSPWKTPLQLYEEKVSEEPPVDVSEARQIFFRRRKRQEPVIAEMLADEYGIEVTALSISGNPNRYIDAELPYLSAEIDFECRMTAKLYRAFGSNQEFAKIPEGSLLNGEIKTVHPFAAREWNDGDGEPDLPIHYAAQALHGMGVTKRPATIVAALFGLDQLLAFPLVREEEIIAGMRERCHIFWEHVRERVAPPPSNLDEIKALYKHYRGTRVELDDAMYALFESRFAAKEEEDRAKAKVERLDYELGQMIYKAWGTPVEQQSFAGPDWERALLIYNGHQVGSWNRQRHTSLDQKRLKEQMPGVVAQYTNEGYHRVLRRKAGPK